MEYSPGYSVAALRIVYRMNASDGTLLAISRHVVLWAIVPHDGHKTEKHERVHQEGKAEHDAPLCICGQSSLIVLIR